MTSRRFAQKLADALGAVYFEDPGPIIESIVDEMDGLSECNVYSESSILTRDDGLVVRGRDGSEFQITIVKR